MALVERRGDHQMRLSNREPDWSSICNNVFDQYLDFDDPFGMGLMSRERSSSDDSKLFDISASSEQSNHTDETSPIPSKDNGFERVPFDAKQPKPTEPIDFWTRKLQALEQNATACEQRQQNLRSTKSHADFLSLGGYPSPPAIPPSPTDQSLSVQRCRPHISANGKKTPTPRCVTLRSVSRGRPMGVTKAPPAAAARPHATLRKSNGSPTKMMNPSRYRAGFKDIWTERIENSPKKYELRAPPYTFPVSPPPSARAVQDDFAAFSTPSAYCGLPFDDQISPLANTFQQTRIHTPVASPQLAAHEPLQPSYLDVSSLSLSGYPYQTNAAQTIPLNDTAPLFVEAGSSLGANRIGSFDFGFTDSSAIEQWSGASFTDPTPAHYPVSAPRGRDPFAIDRSSLPSSEFCDYDLGISFGPNPAAAQYHPVHDTAFIPGTNYQTAIGGSTYYIAEPPHGLPITPHHRDPRARGGPGSVSPSPPLSEPRLRRTSHSRKSSRHRRTKSSNHTPRNSQHLERRGGGGGGGFVNFTPQDSGKILNGVAPSGSSKTKARREKEAADRRRRLSQAAVRAIVEAGGDPNSLTEAGVMI